MTNPVGRRPPIPTGKPLIEWRASGCRCRLLRTFLSPAGWRVIGDRFRETPRDALGRVLKAEDVDTFLVARAAAPAPGFSIRIVPGVDVDLAPMVEDWSHADFEVGCDHGTTWTTTRKLADDVLAVRRSHTAVFRTVEYGTS